MARQRTCSLLRRRGTPAGGLLLLCAVLALPARAATPAPDPPPVAVAPEPPPVTRTQPAQARLAPVTVAPAPVVRRAAPVVRSRSAQTPSARRDPVVKRTPVAKTKAKAKAVARPAPATTLAAPVPHDRFRLPVVALVTADALDRGLLAFAGTLLLVTTLSGGMVLWAGRRLLEEGVL